MSQWFRGCFLLLLIGLWAGPVALRAHASPQPEPCCGAATCCCGDGEASAPCACADELPATPDDPWAPAPAPVSALAATAPVAALVPAAPECLRAIPATGAWLRWRGPPARERACQMMWNC